jgi:hypothetical protein
MSGLVPWARGQQSLQQSIPYAQPGALVPVSPPSGILDWWRAMKAVEEVKPPSAVESAVVGLRYNAESAAIGALAALIDTDLGGLDLMGRIPLDWAGAAFFYALSVHNSSKPNSLAPDYQAMSQSCTTIAMYRTIHRWRENKKSIPQNTPSMTGDPVLKASKSF